MTFASDEAAYDLFYRYGVHCRFDIRCGPAKKHRDGTILKRYLYCNKEGFVVNNSLDTENGKRKKGSRNCTSSRCGCKAKLFIKLNGASDYIVTEFVERHNHGMASVDAAQFLKCRRKMKTEHKRFVFGCGKANLGSVRSYKLSKHPVGGYVGAQKNDFHNFHRDVVAFIGLDDAQLVLNNLVKKKEMCSSFFYEYSVDKGALSGIFWADSICQLNFHAFGDVLTFDATYSLNRYNMIFVPFTGIDNHKKSVTFAAALLSREDVESYTWMLECFKKCMGQDPQIVLTDQGPALRVVVPKVMPDAHHRWTSKDDFAFRKQKFIFWMLFESTIDSGWFFMGFDTALESQRQIRSMCDHEARTKRSRTRTPLLIELHALDTYTTTIFQAVQTEICASCFDVSIITVAESENGKVHEVVDGRYKKNFSGE
ncbi:hypothetical protein QQ045_019683 [Rhodiola kirilowii]